MYKIILNSSGANRIPLISKIAANLGIDRATAKNLVDTPKSTIGFGDYRQVAELLDVYGDLGADLDCEYWPEGMHPESWSQDISSDGSTCSHCGHALFYNIPGRTTDEELKSAMQLSSHIEAQAGAYCPNCGRSIRVNLGEPLAWCRYRPRWLRYVAPVAE